MTDRWRAAGQSGETYDSRWEALAAEGKDVHGEATFVATLDPPPASVLDAGCGTGRVAIELARRGLAVVGVDLDAGMLAKARRKAPELDWVEGDLARFDLGRAFDAVVMAGNVILFVEPDTETTVIARCAGHVAPGGVLVAGFQLGRRPFTLDDYDAGAAASGLVLDGRFATWDRDPYAGGDYAVTVHRRTRSGGPA